MKHRSLFGPTLLITAGVLWLLVSLGVVPAGNLWALEQFAPFALMGFGLALLVRSRWETAGQILSALVLVAAIAVVFLAPQLGWNKPGFLNFNLGLPGSVPGSGLVTSETRKTGEFNAIEIRYPAEVVVQQGSAPAVKIEAEDNLIKQISTAVSGGMLVIDQSERDWSKRVNPSKPVKISITVTDLKEIQFPSAGKLDVNGLESESLKLTLSGAGDVTLHEVKLGQLDGTLSGAGSIHADGSADRLLLLISGMGSFNGTDLASSTAEVRISGAGSAIVNVQKELVADITGAGSVNYFGSPSVQKQISGAGSVSPAK